MRAQERASLGPQARGTEGERTEISRVVTHRLCNVVPEEGRRVPRVLDHPRHSASRRLGILRKLCTRLEASGIARPEIGTEKLALRLEQFAVRQRGVRREAAASPGRAADATPRKHSAYLR